MPTPNYLLGKGHRADEMRAFEHMFQVWWYHTVIP